ncbi:hypothetical protein Hanom_Chr15g01395021 [Helianthus anomalus]
MVVVRFIHRRGGYGCYQRKTCVGGRCAGLTESAPAGIPSSSYLVRERMRGTEGLVMCG